MDSAQDLDVGKNGVQNYTLNPNLHFHLKLQDSEDGRKYPELLLDQPLDREKEPERDPFGTRFLEQCFLRFSEVYVCL